MKNPWLNISLSGTVADCANTMSHSLCGGNRGKWEYSLMPAFTHIIWKYKKTTENSKNK